MSRNVWCNKNKDFVLRNLLNFTAYTRISFSLHQAVTNAFYYSLEKEDELVTLIDTHIPRTGVPHFFKILKIFQDKTDRFDLW